MDDSRVKQYLENGGDLFTVLNIDKIRNGGTVMVSTTKDNFYISKDNKKLYIEDYKLKEAREFIISLDDSKESQLIKYLIEDKDKTIDNQSKQLEKYHNWFKTLGEFSPNINQPL